MSGGIHWIFTDYAALIGTWQVLGVLMVLCFLLFGYLVPKAKVSIFKNVTTQLPEKVLDEYFPSWTPQNAEQFFEIIGAEGRAAYRRFYLTLDFWIPGTIASMTIASIMLIAFPIGSGWAWLCILALPSWLFDIAENITHFKMAGSYPNLSSVDLKVGPLFTRAKWIFAIIPLPIAMIGFIFRVVH